MKNNKREILKVIIACTVALLCLWIFFLTSDTKQESPPLLEKELLVEIAQEPKPLETQTKAPDTPKAPPKEIEHSGTLTTLRIEDKELSTYLTEQTDVYDLMVQVRNEGKINFKETTYAGLGKFIEELNGVENDGSKFWIYYVNGEKAKVGISNYIIRPGDTVSWKFEKDINQ